MRSKYTRDAYVVFVLVVSFFGLVVSTNMLEQHAQPPTEFSGRRMLVGFMYGFVCIAGVVAVFFPGPCSRALRIRRSSEEHLGSLGARATRLFGVLLVHGHHPLGEEDSAAHELRLGERGFCASCFGLLAGAIISLIIIVVFLFSGWTDGYLAHFLYFLGFGGVVSLGLVPALLGIGARIRFVLGVVFVTGACLMLIAMDAATGNLMADLLVIFLAVFWLLSRISLSHRN
jgi:hypothetical protein